MATQTIPYQTSDPSILPDLLVGVPIGIAMGIISHDEAPESGMAVASTTASYWFHAMACSSHRVAAVLDNLPVYRFNWPMTTTVGIYVGLHTGRILKKLAAQG